MNGNVPILWFVIFGIIWGPKRNFLIFNIFFFSYQWKSDSQFRDTLIRPSSLKKNDTYMRVGFNSTPTKKKHIQT